VIGFREHPPNLREVAGSRPEAINEPLKTTPERVKYEVISGPTVG
jgi:hypothetical protein